MACLKKPLTPFPVEMEDFKGRLQKREKNKAGRKPFCPALFLVKRPLPVRQGPLTQTNKHKNYFL